MKGLVGFGAAIVAGLAVLCAALLIRTPALEYSAEAKQMMHASPVMFVSGRAEVGQSFTVESDNVAAVSFYVQGVVTEREPGAVVFRLYEEGNASPLVRKDVDVRDAVPGQYVQVVFEEIRRARGKRLVFTLENEEEGSGNSLVLGGTTWDSYTGGQMMANEEELGGDLSFVAFSRPGPGALIGRGLGAIAGHWRPLALLGAILFLSSAAIWPFVRAGGSDGVTGLAATAASSPLVAVVVMAAVDGLGLKFNLYAMIAGCLVLGAAVVVVVKPRVCVKRVFNVEVLGLAAVSCLVLIVQMSFIKGVALPAYLDSVHHVTLAEEIVRSGRLPANVPVEGSTSPLVYHIGIHATTAAVTLLSNETVSPEVVLLVEGPLLLALYALGVYALVRTAGCDHWCGLAGMVLATFAFAMPTFALNWGKYPLILAVATFPGVLSLFIISLESRTRVWTRVAIGLLIAGNILAHTRMVFVWIVVMVVAAVVSYRQCRSVKEVGGKLAAYGAGPCVVLGLWLLPRWWEQVHVESGQLPRAVGAAIEGVPASPALYRFENMEMVWIAVLVAGFLLMKDRKLAPRGYVTLAIIGLTATSLIAIPSVPGARLIDAPFAHTAVALPLVMGLALVIGYAQEVFGRMRRLPSWTVPVAVALTAVVAVSAWPGVPSLVGQLATRDDLAAMRWIEESTSTAAVFGVATAPWQNGQVVGVDGGYWVQALTGRKTTMPSLLYGFADAYTQAVTAERALAVDTSIRMKSDVCRLAVDYIYAGRNALSFERPIVESNPHLAMAYESGPIAILEVQGCENP